MTVNAEHNATRAQLNAYRAATARLVAALDAHNAARACYDHAKDAHEDARRALLLDGVPGVPERATSAVQEAAMTRATDAQARALRAAREALRAAETELEAARVLERAEREVLRVVTVDATE